MSERDVLGLPADSDAERLHFIVEASRIGTWEWNVQTNQTVFNEIWARMLGYTIEELTPYSYATWKSLTHPEDLANAEKQLALCLTGKLKMYDCEIRMRHKEGHWVWILDRGRIMTWDAEGKPLLMFGTHTDITARKTAEEELKESRERLEYALSAVNDGLFDWNVKTGQVFFDARYYTMAGYEPDEFPHQFNEWATRVHPDDLSRSLAEVERHLAGKTRIFDIVFRFRRKDESWMWIRGRGRIIERDAEGKPVRMIGTHTDCTRQMKAESALRQSEERFQKMLGVIPDMVSIHDPAMNVLYSNWQGYAAVAPERRICGEKCYKIYRGYDTVCPDCVAHKVLETGKPVQTEAALPDGRWVDLRVIPILDDQGRVEVFVEWVRDITEQKKALEEREKLQAQLAHSQKMESIGRLAGGVAHDFNNMLGVILGHADMVIARLDSQDPCTDDLQEIRRAAQRSAELTRQLLAFARKQVVTPRRLDLNQAIEGSLQMMRRLIGENVSLQWKPGPLTGSIFIDPLQIDQILANLCVNARDAISGNGCIIVETGSVNIDQTYAQTNPAAVPGEYLLLSVSDNGCGMSAETLSHLFEPFFTTKELGKGTGLGLATVYGIVRQNRGFINVYSEPGHGTTFRLYLPRHDRLPAEEQAENGSRDMRKGRECILLVEDEPAILNMTAKMLRKLGYTVFPAATPSEAFQLAEAHAGRVQLLLTDVVMPDLNGRELSQKLMKMFPDLRCLYMSGYSASVIEQEGILEEHVSFLPKPFTFQELAEKIREVLDEPTPSSDPLLKS